MKRVLVVDDRPSALVALTMLLQGHVEVVGSTSQSDAMLQLQNGTFDAVVSDYNMPPSNGIVLLEYVHKKFPAIRRVLMSGRSFDVESWLRSEVIHAFLLKPSSAEKILAAIKGSQD